MPLQDWQLRAAGIRATDAAEHTTFEWRGLAPPIVLLRGRRETVPYGMGQAEARDRD